MSGDFAVVETNDDGSPKTVHVGFASPDECRSWFAGSGLVLAWITPVLPAETERRSLGEYRTRIGDT